MCNTLVTESDVTSSMMGEMYRQLASAQLRGKLYKTGYRRARAIPRETQGGVTGQTSVPSVGCGVSAFATRAPAPSTTQLRTPPKPVRLVTTPRALVPAQTTAITTMSSPIPQTPIINVSRIQDKAPQPVTMVKQEPLNVTTAAPDWKATVVVKRRGRPKTQPVATCQVLDTIEEVNEDSQVYSDLDFGETESEVADLCEILEENSDLDTDEPLIDLASDQA